MPCLGGIDHLKVCMLIDFKPILYVVVLVNHETISWYDHDETIALLQEKYEERQEVVSYS